MVVCWNDSEANRAFIRCLLFLLDFSIDDRNTRATMPIPVAKLFGNISISRTSDKLNLTNRNNKINSLLNFI